MTQKLYPFGTIDYIGHNDAANMVDTSLVVANEDGSLLERTEWIIAVLAGGGGRLRFQQSISTVAEDKAVVMFSVSLYDFNTGAIPVADIDISGITQTMQRSRGGGAFAPVTAPVFLKDDGRVYCAYEFLDADWEVGDVYKLTLSGVEVDIAGDTVYVPAMIWSNMVQEQVDLHSKVDAIQEDIGDPSARTNLQSLEEMLGNPDVADKTIYETQAVPAEDSPTDAQIRDVVGKKSDTIAGSSLVSATKRLEALHPVPTEDAATDVSMRDVVGKKSDTVAGSSLVALAKRTQDDLGSFRTRTHLDSLLMTLGVPDTAGKDLYTVLTADRLDSATFGLAAIKAAVDAILPAGGIGVMRLASALIDLEQAVGDYDLFTCSVAGVVLEKLIFVNANRDASGDAVFTYFTIQTDAVTPQVVFNSTTGDKANLTEEAQFSWTGAIYVPVGGKVQLTIAGGPTDSAHECTIIAQYRAVGVDGTLG